MAVSECDVTPNPLDLTNDNECAMGCRWQTRIITGINVPINIRFVTNWTAATVYIRRNGVDMVTPAAFTSFDTTVSFSNGQQLEIGICPPGWCAGATFTITNESDGSALLGNPTLSGF
jgi:hypothetical protein